MLAFVVGPNPGKNGNPLKSLFGFTRLLAVTPGTSQTVNFPLTAFDLSVVDENGKRMVDPGVWKVVVEGAETLIKVA